MTIEVAEGTVKELGNILRKSEEDPKVTCPTKTDDVCSYRVNDHTLSDYSIRQIVKYPYCERQRTSLVLIENENR
jgi:hypothetical protein